MSRPRILFLCQTLPYPPDGGVKIRSFNILRLLSKTYDVSALCFVRRGTVPDLESSVAALRKLAASVDAFPIEQEQARIRLVRDHLESTLFRRVYTVQTYRNAAFSRRLRELVRSGAHALAHMDSLDLSGHLPKLAGIPTICTHHNVESVLLRRRAALEGTALRRRYLMMQADLMEREERRWCPGVALNVVVSEDDRTTLSQLAPGSRIAVVPNGVDTDEFRPREQAVAGMVFVGGMTWFPNKDALEYFASEILPLLADVRAAHPVTWVGRALPGAAESYAARGVRLTGYVDSIQPHVQAAACYVVPLRVGGGTRLKILDAWAMGKAIVSTSVGCEGLEARDGWNILIRNDPREFADAVRAVLADPELRERLGRNARRTAEDVYSWDVIGRHMMTEYEKVRAATRAGG